MQGEAQQKYVYFILAANGSAIGFTVQFIISKGITQNLWVLFIAIVCWGFSFFLGCRYLIMVLKILLLQQKLIRTPNDPAYNKLFDEANRRGAKKFNWMFRFLMAGVFVFITWFFIWSFPHIAMR